MTPERERQIERICQEALEREAGARDPFLREACASDQALRREVDSLLAHTGTAEHFLAIPVLEAEAREMAAPIHALAAGQRIGVYTIVSQLGAGGMGEV